MIPGIDISSHQQGPLGIDWPTVTKYLTSQDPNAFVIVKVSEGTNYVNPHLHPQRDGAHAAGIKMVGLYHFARPSSNSGHAEAQYFLDTIGSQGGVDLGEFYALDLEDDLITPTADLAAYVADFRGVVERSSGLKCVVYSRDDYLAAHNVTVDPADYWCAAPGATTPPNAAIWQYDWQGQVPGIATPVDLDYLLTPLTDFQARHCWGFQPNPIPGPILPPADLDPSWDAPTAIKHVYAILAQSPAPVDLARADLAAILVKYWGLQGGNLDAKRRTYLDFLDETRVGP